MAIFFLGNANCKAIRRLEAGESAIRAELYGGKGELAGIVFNAGGKGWMAKTCVGGIPENNVGAAKIPAYPGPHSGLF
jgi:hypothetical protein